MSLTCAKLDSSEDRTWKEASLATQGLVTRLGDRTYIYEKTNDPLGEGVSKGKFWEGGGAAWIRGFFMKRLQMSLPLLLSHVPRVLCSRFWLPSW